MALRAPPNPSPTGKLVSACNPSFELGNLAWATKSRTRSKMGTKQPAQRQQGGSSANHLTSGGGSGRQAAAAERQLYEAFLKSDWVHSSLDGGSPLAALTILKKICDHPLLLTKKAAEGVLEGMDSMLNHEELGLVEEMAKKLANNNSNDLQQLDHNESCKICFIMTLLDNLIDEGHTVLIFSQTRKMLNLIQEAITTAGYRYLRIDGTTKFSDRESIVKDFQEGRGVPIFLLTSQVGGLGLTLTKADHVIVVDRAWNPSMDNQSVDRAYRIG